MKRKICVILFAAVLISCMVVPVSAADLDVFYSYNVLDFATANDSGSNFRFTSSGSNLMSFSLIRNMIPRSVDMIVSMQYAPSSVSFVANGEVYPLTVISIGDDLYRIYGDMGRWNLSAVDFDFVFAEDAWVDFKSVKLSTFKTLFFPVEAYLNIQTEPYEATIHYVPTDERNQRDWWMPAGQIDDYLFTLYCPDWRKFDYIDFYVYTWVKSVNSISCSFNGQSVPLAVTYIDNSSDSSFLDYHYLIRLDLTSLDRSLSGYPRITITGICNSDAFNLVSVTSVCGAVVSSNIDNLFYYFGDLKSSLSAFFSSLSSSISGHFSNLNSWIYNQTASVENFFNWYFSNLNNTIYDRFSSLFNWIQDQTNILESAIRGDTASGDSFQNEVQQKEDELENMAAVMDSVTKPDINSINVSVDQYVAAADVSTLTAPLTVFLTGDIFGPMVIMSILMATVSFVLYGKR